jgi:ferredoxin
MRIVWDEKKCAKCLACVSVCPKNAIEFKDGKIVINEEKCVKCGNCVRACPMGALRFEEN